MGTGEVNCDLAVFADHGSDRFCPQPLANPRGLATAPVSIAESALDERPTDSAKCPESQRNSQVIRRKPTGSSPQTAPRHADVGVGRICIRAAAPQLADSADSPRAFFAVALWAGCVGTARMRSSARGDFRREPVPGTAGRGEGAAGASTSVGRPPGDRNFSSAPPLTLRRQSCCQECHRRNHGDSDRTPAERAVEQHPQPEHQEQHAGQGV